MGRVHSNGPSKDFVFNPFAELLKESKEIYVATPYVTKTEDLLQAAKDGKSVKLLVGLNAVTSPDALRAVHEKPNIEVRYYTHRFHPKIYLFDHAALVGSSNLTEPGLRFNREATVRLDEPDDTETIEELRTLFMGLWDPAPALTVEKLKTFEAAHKGVAHVNPDALIEGAVGRAEPPNVNVASQKMTTKRIFLERLRRQVLDYRKSFNEVKKLLEENHFRRVELEDVASANETNRFLNWVRLVCAPGDDAWKDAPLRSQEEARREEIIRLGREWTDTEQSRIPDDYTDWLHLVQATFGSSAAIDGTSKEELTKGLMSIHAFHDRLRYKGGTAQLPIAFWKENNEDVGRVKRTLKYLLYGGGDFIERLHDVLYNQGWNFVDSDDADHSIRSDADQCGAQRRRTLSV